jgi:hypothetical protein
MRLFDMPGICTRHKDELNEKGDLKPLQLSQVPVFRDDVEAVILVGSQGLVGREPILPWLWTEGRDTQGRPRRFHYLIRTHPSPWSMF